LNSEPAEHGQLTVVLVSYNTSDLLLRLLERLGGADWIVPIVIDNASVDGSAHAVATRYPAIELVRNAENVGFARAANQGIARAKTEHVALVNPDTDISSQLLGDLSDYLERHPDVWAVAPRLVGGDGKAQTLAAGFRPTPARGFLYFLGLSYILPWPAAGFSVPPGIVRPIEVDWLSGACLVFRSEVVERVGALDESFFLYGEDMDWCRRMRAAGGRLVLVADHDLQHSQGASSGHEVVSTDWLIGLIRYVLPLNSELGARLFFVAAAIGFVLRGVRSSLPGFRRRRSLFAYAGTAARIALSPVSLQRRAAGARSRPT
jgi:GT2 family glycosyltransferase